MDAHVYYNDVSVYTSIIIIFKNGMTTGMCVLATE